MPRPDQPGGHSHTRHLGKTNDAIIGTLNDGQHIMLAAESGVLDMSYWVSGASGHRRDDDDFSV
jgi:hypothetical protein